MIVILVVLNCLMALGAGATAAGAIVLQRDERRKLDKVERTFVGALLLMVAVFIANVFYIVK